MQSVLNGSVALVVFKQAIAEVPKEAAVRRKFLDILSSFSFPGVAAIYEVNGLSMKRLRHIVEHHTCSPEPQKRISGKKTASEREVALMSDLALQRLCTAAWRQNFLWILRHGTCAHGAG